MYITVFSPDGEAFEVTRDRADKLILLEGWTQTKPVVTHLAPAEPEPEPEPEPVPGKWSDYRHLAMDPKPTTTRKRRGEKSSKEDEADS